MTIPRSSRRLREAAERVAIEAIAASIPSSAPLRDTRLDDRVRALPTFPDLETAIHRSRRLRKMYGAGEAQRLALSWAYGVVRGVGGANPWRAFWSQITDTAWRFVSIANLSNFDSDADVLALPDGLTIRTRSRPELMTSLGWPLALLQRTVGDDWMGGTGSYGRFVIVHDEAVDKEPGNIVLGNTGRNVQSINRLLLALHLHGAGDVGVGTIFASRSEPFPISIGGVTQSAPAGTSQHGGTEFFLPERDAATLADNYGRLLDFEATHASRQQSIVTAFARFTAAYARPWTSNADRLVDDMIGLEALVGTSGPDLTYTLAIRASGLLADNDKDRVELFERMRSFYATRSRLVHGGSLSAKHQSNINREPELRDILRRILRGFTNLCGSAEFYPSRNLLDRIDAILLDARERARLQAEMAAGPPSSPIPTSSPRIVAQWSDQPPSSAIVSVPS